MGCGVAGNTADSGSAIGGSNPPVPAKEWVIPWYAVGNMFAGFSYGIIQSNDAVVDLMWEYYVGTVGDEPGFYTRWFESNYRHQVPANWELE